MADKEQFTALAFKIMSDPFVGRLTYFRVYTGTVAAGSYVYNVNSDRKERIGRLLLMHANHREEAEQVVGLAPWRRQEEQRRSVLISEGLMGKLGGWFHATPA